MCCVAASRLSFLVLLPASWGLVGLSAVEVDYLVSFSVSVLWCDSVWLSFSASFWAFFFRRRRLVHSCLFAAYVLCCGCLQRMGFVAALSGPSSLCLRLRLVGLSVVCCLAAFVVTGLSFFLSSSCWFVCSVSTSNHARLGLKASHRASICPVFAATVFCLSCSRVLSVCSCVMSSRVDPNSPIAWQLGNSKLVDHRSCLYKLPNERFPFCVYS
jgi:hypothetical protein